MNICRLNFDKHLTWSDAIGDHLALDPLWWVGSMAVDPMSIHAVIMMRMVVAVPLLDGRARFHWPAHGVGWGLVVRATLAWIWAPEEHCAARRAEVVEVVKVTTPVYNRVKAGIGQSEQEGEIEDDCVNVAGVIWERPDVDHGRQDIGCPVYHKREENGDDHA